jgi:hypothetical protein
MYRWTNVAGTTRLIASLDPEEASVSDVYPPVRMCKICGRKVVLMVRLGTDLCSTLCEKVDSRELTREQAETERSRLQEESQASNEKASPGAVTG